MLPTMRARFIAALVARGETFVKRNIRNEVYTRKTGGFYYIGDNGSLRAGPNRGRSVPCAAAFKKLLLEEGGNIIIAQRRKQPFKDAGDMA